MEWGIGLTFARPVWGSSSVDVSWTTIVNLLPKENLVTDFGNTESWRRQPSDGRSISKLFYCLCNMWNWGHHFEILKYESKSEGFSSFLELPSLLQVVFIVPDFTCTRTFMVESTVGYALQACLPEGLSVRPMAGRNPRQLLWFTVEQFHISQRQDQFWLLSLKYSQPYKIEKSLDCFI